MRNSELRDGLIYYDSPSLFLFFLSFKDRQHIFVVIPETAVTNCLTMRLTPLPLLVTSTAALVLPDPPLPAHDSRDQQRPLSLHHDDEGASSWWDKVLPSGEDILSVLDDSADYLSSSVDSAAAAFEDLKEQVHDGLADASNGGGHDFPDHTIYQLISESKYTTKFAKLVDEHEDVVKLLNSTSSHNLTLFVPVDEAFEDIPEHHEKPSKEFIENLLNYHIGLGEYRAKRILGTNTIPTAYKEKFLGDEHQRLRTSIGLSGVTVNFYSRVIAANIVSLYCFHLVHTSTDHHRRVPTTVLFMECATSLSLPP